MYDRDLIISQIRQRLEILYQMVEELENQSPGPGPGPGTSDYNDLSNKPSIEGTTLSGNKTAAQLGLATSSSVSSITSRFEDLITPDNIEVEDNAQLPSSVDSRLALHQPIMLNHAIYYCYDESGVDYTYVALDTSGAYPKLSYAQIFKDNKRVHFYDYATDTVPASNSDNFITSGGVYSAIQGLATVARTGSYNDLLNTPTIPDVSNYYTKTETNSEITTAIGALDVATTATSGSYIKSISETDGKISAVAETIDTTPTSASEKPITSGAVYTALGDKLEKKDVYGTGTTIANNTDLNSLQTIGLYRCSSYNSAGTLSNCPTHYAFQMEVTLAGSSSWREQRIYESYTSASNPPSVYRRFYQNSEWTTWYKYQGTAVT